MPMFLQDIPSEGWGSSHLHLMQHRCGWEAWPLTAAASFYCLGKKAVLKCFSSDFHTPDLPGGSSWWCNEGESCFLLTTEATWALCILCPAVSSRGPFTTSWQSKQPGCPGSGCYSTGNLWSSLASYMLWASITDLCLHQESSTDSWPGLREGSGWEPGKGDHRAARVCVTWHSAALCPHKQLPMVLEPMSQPGMTPPAPCQETAQWLLLVSSQRGPPLHHRGKGVS